MDEFEHTLFWIASGLGLVGTLLNAYHIKEGFLFWMISNPILVYQAIQNKSRNIALMFTVYFMLSILGLYQWSV